MMEFTITLSVQGRKVIPNKDGIFLVRINPLTNTFQMHQSGTLVFTFDTGAQIAISREHWAFYSADYANA